MAICRKPFYPQSTPFAFGCGQCIPCRVNRRRLWVHRLLLEQKMHGDSVFLTLTYDKDHHPDDGSLQPRDIQLFLKKLRKAVSPRKVRFFFVGEYGDRTWRPHYHAALYGISMAEEGVLRRAWTKGFIFVGDLTPASAAYIGGYVTKKLTRKGDPRLAGRHPEFARMSLKPGIGATAMSVVADALTTDPGSDLILANGDVPTQLLTGGKLQPLGRYLSSKLRECYGFEEISTPKEKLSRLSQEMCLLPKAKPGEKMQKVLNIESRQLAKGKFL